ncbi:MAG: FG-GAP-like repeat-containing protein [Terriglobales bacterium]
MRPQLLRTLLFSSVLIIAAAGDAQVRPIAQHGRAQQNPPKHVPGQMLVKYRAGLEPLSKLLNDRHAAQVKKQFRGTPGLQLIELRDDQRLTAVLSSYRSNPAVEYAEPNYVISLLDSAPSDPDFAQQWALRNVGQLLGKAGADINASAAWNLTKGDGNVVVAIIDTGIDYKHPDLAPNIFQNTADCDANGIDDDGDGYVDDCYGINTSAHTSDPLDDYGHGTHVAGIIGAAANNGLGVVGVNWNVKLLPCKFIDSRGYGTVADAVECLDWLRVLKQRGINIVASNNSWGFPFYSQALADAVKAQEDAGILFIAAAGNDFETNDLVPVYPASLSYGNVITVAATNRFDELASFSNTGRWSVHLGAPGEEIFSTLPGATYGYETGTSMAAPFVTGVAALLKAQDPSRDWKTIKNLLLSAGDSLPALRDATITGRRLNAFASLTCSNSSQLSRIAPPGNIASLAAASPVTIAVLNLDCGSPGGPVTANIPATGETIVLKDDGLAPDERAGDGIFSGQWTPPGLGTFTIALTGGDQFSIEVLRSYYAQAEPGNYRIIAGQNLDLSDDSVAELLAPFPLKFGGATFAKLYISSNGTISLTEAFGDYYNRLIPLQGLSYFPYGWNHTAAILIAPFWDDLYPVKGSAQNVFWEVRGTAPSRELVVEWRDVRFFDCSSDPSATIRFEAVFSENSDDLLFQYAKVSNSCPSHNFSMTVGVQVDPRTGSSWTNGGSVWDGAALRWRLLADDSSPNPLPVVYKLDPPSTLPISGPLDVKITGSNFVSSSQVFFSNSGRATTYVSPSEVRVSLLDSDTKIVGLWPVKVTNPAPGGGESNELRFVVGPTPPPLITSASPPSAVAGGPGFTLTITGQNLYMDPMPWIGFGKTRHINVNVISNSVWQVNIPAEEIANPGTVNVQVGNRYGESNILLFTISPYSSNSGNLPVQNNGQGGTFALKMPQRFYGWRFGEHLPAYTKAFSERVYAGGAMPVYKNAWASGTGGGVGPSAFIPTVVAPPAMPTGFIPTSVAVGDFNGDGRMDWAVANGGDNTLWFYPGNGDGTADAPYVIPLLGGSPTAVAAVDLRGVGILDLVVAEADSFAIEVLLGKGDGTFSSAGQQFVPGIPNALVVGDFNGDGYRDVVVSVFAFDGFGAVAMCPGDGTGKLGNPVISRVDDNYINYSALSVASGDFNSDGLPDLVMLYGITFDGFSPMGSRVFMNDGTGRFKPGQTLFGIYPDIELNFATGDVNKDGCVDIVAPDVFGLLQVHLGACDGSFGAPTAYPIGEAGWGIVLADVDGDGNLDAIVSGVQFDEGGPGYGFESGQLLGVASGDGQGGFRPPRVYRGRPNVYSIAAADLNGDGKLDIVTADQDTDTSTQFINDGHGGFGKASGGYIGYLGGGQTGAVNQPFSDVFVHDINGDGKPDLVWLTSRGYTNSPMDITTILNQGQGGYSAPIRSTALQARDAFGGWAFGFGNFRNVGREDLVLVGGWGGSYTFIANNGDGTFTSSARITRPTGGVPVPYVATGDFNDDGKLDFAIIEQCDVAPFTGNGDGTFAEKPVQQFTAQPGSSLCSSPWPAYAYVGDFNHDGRLDILFQEYENVVPYRNHDVYLLLGNGDGSFQPPQKVLSNLRRIQVADLDHDGNPDIVEAAEFTGWYPSQDKTQVNIYLGRPDGSFVLTSSYSDIFAGVPVAFDNGSATSPNGGAAWLADFDGDGNVDIASFQLSASYMRYGLVQFLHGNGDGTFTPMSGVSRLGTVAWPTRAVDFTGTGRADFIEFDGFTCAFQIIPLVAGSNLSGFLSPQPFSSNASTLYLRLSVAQSDVATVALFASDPGVALPATVEIPAGSTSVEVPITLGPGVNRTRVLKITATMGDDSAAIYGVAANIPTGLSMSSSKDHQSVIAGTATWDYQVGVDSVGGYSGRLTATCEGLPAGAACHLSPTVITVPAGGGTGISTVVTTSSDTPLGTYKFAVVLTDGITTVRQWLTLSVADFSVRLAEPVKIAFIGGRSAIFDLAVDVTGDSPDGMDLTCSGLPSFIHCQESYVFAGVTTRIYVSVSLSATPAIYPFTMIASSKGVQRSVNATLRVVDIYGAINPAAATLAINHAVDFDLTVSAPAGFYEPLTIACLSPYVRCTVQSPLNFPVGATSMVVRVTMTAITMPTAQPAPTVSTLRPPQLQRAPLYLSLGVVLCALFLPCGRLRNIRPLLLILVAVAVIASLASCGGGGGGSGAVTSPSTYTPPPTPPPPMPSPTPGATTVIIQGSCSSDYYTKELARLPITVTY